MCSVFVGNIAWDVSEQELGDWFSQMGRVNSAYASRLGKKKIS